LKQLLGLRTLDQISESSSPSLQTVVCESKLYKQLLDQPQNLEVFTHLQLLLSLEDFRLKVLNLQEELISQMYDEKLKIEQQLIEAKFSFVSRLTDVLCLKNKVFQSESPVIELALVHIQNLITDHQIFKGAEIPVSGPMLAGFDNPKISRFCEMMVGLINKVKVSEAHKKHFAKVMLIKEKVHKMQKCADSDSQVSLIWLELCLGNFKRSSDAPLILDEPLEFEPVRPYSFSAE
jgi:hypothetical protein